MWVAEAVHALAEDGRSEVTVNDVAAELGIDQSGASRMLTDAASRGYLDIAPSLVDGRRRATALTPVGRELLERAHAWQEQVFARLTQDWTERERAEFHRGMLRLIAASHDDAAG
ncbi:MarR family winged helix-turn-helix transcriptional regulator [Ornithinimicrobium sufpigmenti]|uniref:MarR family winged helix-turn-helix transcriptional regulator n=1 Tax=Ornithinimicrobium sufpigmenti TaxID=2508882 RepID=UPI00192D78E6|nr:MULTISPECIES: MarR family winged helix-turn-helix transcriptional regulator [unclassified Ornithinimicrobium]